MNKIQSKGEQLKHSNPLEFYHLIFLYNLSSNKSDLIAIFN